MDPVPDRHNIVGRVVSATPGVVDLYAKNVTEVAKKMIQKDNYSTGIIIEEVNNNTIKITISIIASAEIRLSEVAKNIIENVKNDIEKITDLNVSNVTVTIHGVKEA